MDKVCIIVDDTTQKANFDTHIKRVLVKENINAILKYINPREQIYQKNNKIDFEAIKQRISELTNNTHICLFASDYDLGSSEFDGIDLIQYFHSLRQKTPRVIYSGSLNNVISDVITMDGDVDTKIEKLKSIYGVEFSGKQYYSKVIEILRNKDLSVRDELLSKLKEHHDFSFQSCYPAFQGKTLGFIAKEIEQDSYQGKQFQSELIEQAISYLIKINS